MNTDNKAVTGGGEASRGGSYGEWLQLNKRADNRESWDDFLAENLRASGEKAETDLGKAPSVGANGIKIGDTLKRVNDHLGRPNHSVKVIGKRLKPAVYDLEGYWRKDETAKSLSAQGYRIVERNGQTLTFFVRYW